MSCANAAAPLQMPWMNVTVTPDGQSVSRGFGVGIGTPPQILSLRPAINENDLWVSNVANCVSKGNDTCVAPVGGVYSASNSSTFVQATEAGWNGTHSSQITDGSYIFFNDDLQFASGPNGTSYGFPFYMNQPNYDAQGGLPLGSNSTFLDYAVASGAAPSRAFGLWTGTRNVEAPVDGLLVIGGYDTARVTGELTTYPAFSSCSTCPQVVNITYSTPEGQVPLFANSSQSMYVSLEPFERSLGVPQDVFDRFTNASGGTYDPDLESITYSASNPPTGNMTVTLKGGYTTVIPASELFAPPRGYNSQGQYVVTNSSYILAEVVNGTDPKYTVSWGIPYLTMNYLIVDYDKAQFQLAAANRNDTGDKAAAIAPLCSGIATASSSPTPLPSTSASALASANMAATSTAAAAATSTGHSSDTGAIVGGVVGGVLGLALIGALLFFLLRRSKKRGQPQPVTGHDRMSQYTGTGTTEVSGPQSYDPSVNHWVHGQPQPQMAQTYAPPPQQYSHYEQPAQQGYYDHVSPPQQYPQYDQPAHQGNYDHSGPLDEAMSPTMSRPFEMPVHHDI